jgi:glyoxylase-like metal-dependent hydrolase (beta-lactamase superfamily II)
VPGITAHLAPGHTPGHLIYLLNGSEQDVIFTGDAAKNRAELVSRTADMTYDARVTAGTIAMIWSIWRGRPGSIVVPGHDLPMTREDGIPRYSGEREAAIPPGSGTQAGFDGEGAIPWARVAPCPDFEQASKQVPMAWAVGPDTRPGPRPEPET